MSDRRVDHLLRIIWMAYEKEAPELKAIESEYGNNDFLEVLQILLRDKLVTVKGHYIQFTAQGKRAGEEIIRRYRLAERLFADLLEIPPSDYEWLACNFEHILSPEVTDSVCTFLGHPRVCPHNRPIPQGKCCVSFVNDVKPLVQPLTTLSLGQKARIVYIFPVHKKRWGQLHQFGVFPGNTIKLIQKRPSYVIEIGGTTLALDDEICRDIYVKKMLD